MKSYDSRFLSAYLLLDENVILSSFSALFSRSELGVVEAMGVF